MVYVNRIFKPTKQRISKRPVFGFDIETGNNGQDIYAISIYSNTFKKTYTNVTDFFNDIKSKHIFRNSIMVATNLSYDLLGCLWKNQEIASKFSMIQRGKGSSLMMARTFVYKKEFYKYKINNSCKSITFIDTLNYTFMSVKKMGVMLNIPKIKPPRCIIKGVKPKSINTLKKVYKYNMRDAKITYSFYQFLKDSVEKLGGTMKITIASTSMSLFTNRFLKKKYIRMNEKILDFQFNSYRGGRTEAFERGRIKTLLKKENIKQLYQYDVNSMYPYVMKKCKYPHPNSLKFSNENTLKYIKNYLGCSKVRIKTPTNIKYPFLQIHKDKKLIAPIGTFEGNFTHCELNYAMSIGYEIISVFKTQYFTKNVRPFNKYVKTLYEKRLELKQQNSPMEKVVKLFLNSLYGKFGQKYKDRSYIEPIDKTIKQFKDNKDFEFLPLDKPKYVRFSNITTNPANFCVPIWASYITSYARIELHKHIVNLKAIYVDTDSILTRQKIKTSKLLGGLKLESLVHDGYIVRCKNYCVLDKTNNIFKSRLKGYPKRFKSLAQFTKYLKNPKLHYRNFVKLKTALRQNKNINSVEVISKVFDLNDTKRIWCDKFNMKDWVKSKPIKLKI